MNKLAIVFCFALAAACGGSTPNNNSDGGGGVFGSCAKTAMVADIQIQTCYDVIAGTANADALAMAKPDCQNVQGTWSTSACNRANSVGGCQEMLALTGAQKTTWYYPSTTADDVKKSCDAVSGKLTSP